MAVALASSVAQGESLPPWWQIPASGTITVELEDSFYSDPPFTLQVFDALDLDQANEVIEATVSFQWPCEHRYFFEPAPALCPAGESIVSAAAEQPFEGGVMLWLEATESIYVFDRSDSSWQRFEDTWSEEQPENDPTIVPPAERFQPIRGFGKLWRDNPEVQDELGWALGPELGFESILQLQLVEHEGTAVSFLKTFNGQVFGLTARAQDQGRLGDRDLLRYALYNTEQQWQVGESMIKIKVETEISCPVEEVFEFTVSSDFDSQWQSGVLVAAQTSEGPMAVGTTFMQDFQFLGRRVSATFEVTEYTPNKSFGFKSTSGPIPIEGTYAYEKLGEGSTRVTMRAESEVGGFFKLAEPLVSRAAQRQWEANFLTVKDILETNNS